MDPLASARPLAEDPPAFGNRRAWARLLATMAAPVALLLLGTLFNR